MNTLHTPSQKRLKELFTYHQDGYFIRKIDVSTAEHCRAGVAVVGANKKSKRYRYIYVDGKQYPLHRLIRQWHFGDVAHTMHVDHADRDSLNNRIENLRMATPTENTRNRVTPVGKSGFKGVRCRATQKNPWEAIIQIGSFATAEEAHGAYKRASALIFGEFACA